MAEKFEDLRAWQTARTLTNNVYALSRKEAWNDDRTLKDQIRRASVSAMSNIALHEYFFPGDLRSLWSGRGRI